MGQCFTPVMLCRLNELLNLLLTSPPCVTYERVVLLPSVSTRMMKPSKLERERLFVKAITINVYSLVVITLHECLKAHDALKGEGINVRVFDPFCIKPIDAQGIIANAKACGGKVVTVEDHYPEGGIGEAVSGAVSMEGGIRVKRLAVTGLPRSGPSAALIEMFGISSNHVINAVKSF